MALHKLCEEAAVKCLKNDAVESSTSPTWDKIVLLLNFFPSFATKQFYIYVNGRKIWLESLKILM